MFAGTILNCDRNSARDARIRLIVGDFFSHFERGLCFTSSQALSQKASEGLLAFVLPNEDVGLSVWSANLPPTKTLSR